MSFSRAILATSLRTASKLDKTTASGVSSMIRSTPVRVSSVRIFRPSRPIIRPFISSLGSCTSETVDSDTTSAAHFCIAPTTISLAFLSDSSLALDSISLIIIAVSCFTSSSTVLSKYSLACSEVSPEILSSSCCLFEDSSSTSACFFAKLASLAVRDCSLLSKVSLFLSRFSSR